MIGACIDPNIKDYEHERPWYFWHSCWQVWHGTCFVFFDPMWWFPLILFPVAFVLICLTEHLFSRWITDHKKWLHTLMATLMRSCCCWP